MPSNAMLQSCLTAPLGDDVFSEDPTVALLESTIAKMFNKSSALYLPSGTMSNLCGIMAHCNVRNSEIIIGSNSHLSMYEGGNISTIAAVASKQIPEDPITSQMNLKSIGEAIRGDDQHFPITRVVSLENTHNVMGGVPLATSYVNELRTLIDSVNFDTTGGSGRAATSHYVDRHPYDDRNVKIHVDGARIFNAAESLNENLADMCASVDSISVCLSKGLGAPVGSVLVADEQTIRKARRARKAMGGGMRQSGILAAMALHALENNVERLKDDRENAVFLSQVMVTNGFTLPESGTPRTNILYFGVNNNSRLSINEVVEEFRINGVALGGGYQGGRFCRAVLNSTVNNRGVEVVEKAIIKVGAKL